MPLADLCVLDIEQLLEGCSDLATGTRNRILSTLSAMLQRAVELGYLTRNPARGMRRAREHMTALPLVSPADQERLIQQLPARMRLLFLAALDTGARLGELLRLERRDVDLDTGSLLLRQTKSRRPRIVRLSRRLVAQLAPSCADDGAPARIFKDARGADGCLRWAWRKAFKRAAAAIRQPALRIHDLRHLAAINLVRAGVDLPTVQAHLGHKHLLSTLRYAAYADETASARAVRALEGLHARISGEGGVQTPS
jgi:integrase